jgi:hypothetical protein
MKLVFYTAGYEPFVGKDANPACWTEGFDRWPVPQGSVSLYG